MSINVETLYPIIANLRLIEPLDSDPSADNFQQYGDWYQEGLHGKGRNEVIETIFTSIITAPGARQVYLFTGTIGSGKSTELRRLAHKMRQKEHFSVVVDVLRYLDPQQKPHITDLLMAIALGVTDAACQALKQSEFRQIAYDRFITFWRTEIKIENIEVGVDIANVGTAKIQAALQSNPVFRQKLRDRFESSLEALVEAVNQYMGKMASAIKAAKKLPDRAKCLLIVDSLEHFGGFALPGKNDEVLDGILTIFNQQNRHLRINGWSVLYSVSPLLQRFCPGLLALFGSTNYFPLTSAHVYKDHSDAADHETIDNILLPLLKKRFNLDGAPSVAALMGDEALKTIIQKSGGDLRDLLRFTASALLQGITEDTFPVSATTLTKVFRNLAGPYLPLPQNTLTRLRYVNKHKKPPLENPEDWGVVMADLIAKRVLVYKNGEEWFDVHPLIRDHLAE